MTQLEDGKIFLKDRQNIKVLDHMSGALIWEKELATKQEPLFLENLPIVIFEGSPFTILNASNGTVLDKSEEKTRVAEVSYFWEESKVIVQLSRNDILEVLCINLEDLSLSWKYKINLVDKRILRNPILLENGFLALVDKNFVALIDSTGSNPSLFRFKKRIRFLGVNPNLDMAYVLEDKKKLHFLDLKNGNKNAEFEFENKNSTIQILKDEATIGIAYKNMLWVLDGVHGIQVGSQEFDHDIKRFYRDVKSGQCFVLVGRNLIEVDPKTGVMIRTTNFDYSFTDMYRVYEKVILSGRSGLSPIDLETLELEFKTLADIPRVQDYVETGKYICYTNQSGSKFHLIAVDQYGNIGWEDSFSSAAMPSIDVIENGILIMNGKKVRYLNVEDGTSIWDQKVDIDPSFTFGIDEDTNDLYMYSKKRLYKFDYSTGALSKSEQKIKFDDFDYSQQQPLILVLPNSIFLKGSNTIHVVNKSGEQILKKSYPKISNGSTFWTIASVLAAVATITTNDFDMVNIYTDVMYESDYQASRSKFSRRMQQNRSSFRFPYVYTKNGKGKKGLMFLNPTSGKERFFLLMEENEPNYIVDNVDGILFYMDKNKVYSYSIN
ncbi:MAG: hypothetical protein AAGA77_04740 [Bacteroidota bacterium]